MRYSITLPASLFVLAVATAGLAQAAQFPQRDPVFPQRDYTCRYNGADVPLGQRRCLTTTQGAHAAECGIVLNMSSWQPVDAACP